MLTAKPCYDLPSKLEDTPISRLSLFKPHARRTLTGLAAFVVVVVALGVGYLNAHTGAAALMTVAQWQAKYDGVWDRDNADSFLGYSQSGDSWDYYNLAYGIDANTAMFRASGDTKYLDRGLLYVNNMISHAQPSTSLGSQAWGDGYMGWISKKNGSTGDEVPLYESYAWRYVTDMLVAIKQNPGVYAQSAYRNQFDTILAFSEKNMFEKWYSRGPNSYIYRVNAHMAAHWAYISLDLAQLDTDATRRAQELTVVDNIDHHMAQYQGASLHGQMQLGTITPGAYFWNYDWGNMNRPGSDVSHGNGVVSYIVAANALGVDWSSADMAGFVGTLRDVIWPNDTAASDFVDGSGSGSGWFNDGFVKLGRYDTVLQQRLENHNVGQNSQYFGNMALNAKILLGGTTTPTLTPSITPVPVMGDVNHDGHVNVFDLSLLLTKWGSADASADLNHSGTVDVFDLSALLSHWTG